MRGIARAAAVVALLTGIRAGAGAFPAASEPDDFLRTAGGLSAADVEAVKRGQPIVRVLDTDRRQVAVVGAIRIRGSRGRLVEQYRDLSNLRKAEAVLQIGAFGRQPGEDDLRGLTFEPYDLDSVRECQPGDCAVRLSSAAMARFQNGVDWKSPGWRQEVAAIWRQILAELASSYLARGDQALFEYNNKESPLRVAEEFATLYAQSAYVARLAPDALRHVREFPRTPLQGADDLLYWSKDDIGLRPITSVTHLSVWHPADGPLSVIATKQIYATHYFDAALGVTLLFQDGSDAFYMVSMNRGRTRSLTSRFRGFVRSIVQNRSREALEKVLLANRRGIEPGI